ncbi:MAG: endonuclease III [Clostridia bacterium]|nr:endonuclease III [Clostridia bacterium]
MSPTEKCRKIIDILKKNYPDPRCTLDYRNAFELLVSTRLAAQCTDKRVNLTTPKLFSKYPDVYAMAKANLADVERIVKPCGFFKTKARDIVNLSKKIVKDFGGNIPGSMEELTSLPGIGRKTANVILAEIFHRPAVVVDTHFMRITRRLGFHDLKDAAKIEFLMKEIVPENESANFSHRLVAHGREICKAINPKCNLCEIKDFCKKYKEGS